MSLGSVFDNTVPSSEAQVSPFTPAREDRTDTANHERTKFVSKFKGLSPAPPSNK